MQLYDQQQQLNDLPPTFRRSTAIFVQLINSFAAALTLLTQASSALLQQCSFGQAIAGWVDVWSDLSGINRRTGEADVVFSARVPNMLLAARDSVVAIETWLQLIENVVGTVSENLPAFGYSVAVQANVPTSRLQQIVQNLAYVRPAGVPFNFATFSGGTFLNTVNYGGGPASSPWQGGRVTGAYLTTVVHSTAYAPTSSTNNQVSALPDLLITDPTINPP